MFRKRLPYYDEEKSYVDLEIGRVESFEELSGLPSYEEKENSNPPSIIDESLLKVPATAYLLGERATISGKVNSVFVVEEGEELSTYLDYEGEVCSREVFIVKNGARLTLNSVVSPSRFSYINREFYIHEGARVNSNLVGSSFFIELSTTMNLLGYASSGYERSAFILKGKDSARFFSQLNHIGKSTEGDSHVRGVQAGSSTSAVEGMIKIYEGASKSNSYLNQYVMLLDDALSHTYPSLEIENDDVRASHSASVSTLDEEEVFYLMSRGVGREEAVKTIINGFLSSAVDVSSDKRFQRIVEEVVS